MKSNRCSKIKKQSLVLLFQILTTLWPWLKKISSDHSRILRGETWPFQKQVLNRRKKLSHPGLIFREFMSFSYNWLSMKQLKLDRWKSMSLLNLCRNSLSFLIQKNRSREITWKTFFTSFMQNLFQEEKWLGRLSMSPFSF